MGIACILDLGPFFKVDWALHTLQALTVLHSLGCDIDYGFVQDIQVCLEVEVHSSSTVREIAVFWLLILKISSHFCFWTVEDVHELESNLFVRVVSSQYLSGTSNLAGRDWVKWMYVRSHL